MLHTEEIRNESDFRWLEWYNGSPLPEEFQRTFSQELSNDHHLNGVKYFAVYDVDNELLLIKIFPREHRANLSLARISSCDVALCLKNALEEKIVPQCLEEHAELILIPNVPASMREVFRHLASLHESKPIQGVFSILPDHDDIVRVYLRSTLPPLTLLPPRSV